MPVSPISTGEIFKLLALTTENRYTCWPIMWPLMYILVKRPFDVLRDVHCTSVDCDMLHGSITVSLFLAKCLTESAHNDSYYVVNL